MVCITDRGAVGGADATGAGIDDTTAIQNTLDEVAALGNGGEVCICNETCHPGQNGTYLITAPLTLDNTGGGNGRGVRIVGGSGGGRAYGASSLIYDGTADLNMLELTTRDIVVENIMFAPAIGKNVNSMVFINESLDNRATTNNRFLNCQFLSALDGAVDYGTSDYGVQIGNNAGVNQLDFNTFENCVWRGQEEACLYLNETTGQSKMNKLINCHMSSSSALTTDRIGNAVRMRSGSFIAQGCSFFGFERVFFLSTASDNIVVRDSYGERNKRVLDTAFGGASTTKAWNILFDGGTWNYIKHAGNFADLEAYDHEHFFYTHDGTLSLRNLTMGDGATHDADWKVTMQRNSLLMMDSCLVPNLTPEDSGNTEAAVILASKGIASGGAKTILANQL